MRQAGRAAVGARGAAAGARGAAAGARGAAAGARGAAAGARGAAAGARTRHGRAGARDRRTGRPGGRPVHTWVCSAGPCWGFVHPDSVFGPVLLSTVPESLNEHCSLQNFFEIFFFKI